MATMKFYNVNTPPKAGSADGTYYVKRADDADRIDAYVVSQGVVKKIDNSEEKTVQLEREVKGFSSIEPYTTYLSGMSRIMFVPPPAMRNNRFILRILPKGISNTAFYVRNLDIPNTDSNYQSSFRPSFYGGNYNVGINEIMLPQTSGWVGAKLLIVGNLAECTEYSSTSGVDLWKFTGYETEFKEFYQKNEIDNFNGKILSFNGGMVSKTTGGIITGSSAESYQYTEFQILNKNTDLIVTGYESGSGTPCALYDKDFNFIRSVHTNTTGIVTVTVPASELGNAHYYRGTLRNNAAKVFGAQSLSSANNELLRLTSKISNVYSKEESDARFAPISGGDGGSVKKYGMRYDRTNKESYGERILDAVGLNATIGIGSTAGQSDFDNIYPWSEMKRCNLIPNSNGAKIAIFEGDSRFRLDGSNGDVWIRIPRCSVEKRRDGNFDSIIISENGKSHPVFIEDGKVLNEIFMSAFEGGMLSGRYSSVGGIIPDTNRISQDYLNLAKANGAGYTLYDMRTLDLIYCLLAVEFSNRNTNRVLGYGISNLVQPTSSKLLSTVVATSNTFITETTSTKQKAAFKPGMIINICKGSQQNIIANREITNFVENENVIQITFDGSPVSIDLTCYIGSGGQKTNWCETCEVPLIWHTGRAARTTPPLEDGTINPIRYRWIENLWGNIWHYLPDITFSNLQMYVCDNISDYEMHKITSPYRPVSELFPVNLENGSPRSDNVGDGYWVTDLNFDIFAKESLFGREFDNQLQSKDHFGAAYYLGDYLTILANGGGFDHFKRCNMLTQRAWVTNTRQWYLYGARLLYKNI